MGISILKSSNLDGIKTAVGRMVTRVGRYAAYGILGNALQWLAPLATKASPSLRNSGSAGEYPAEVMQANG
jgi:hypothetical protein